MKWFIKCIQNYATFTGRARRAEFWYYVLFVLICLIVARFLDMMLFDNTSVFYSLVGLFFVLPSLAVQVRRLHDIGRSGKILLWYMLSYVTWIVLLLLTGYSAMMALLSDQIEDLPAAFLVVLGIGGVGFIVWAVFFLVWFVSPGDEGANAYGPDPKASEE